MWYPVGRPAAKSRARPWCFTGQKGGCDGELTYRTGANLDEGVASLCVKVLWLATCVATCCTIRLLAFSSISNLIIAKDSVALWNEALTYPTLSPS